ncbi:hypothetical protein MCOR29_009792 [Pyricularia oryzae]|uniref:Uncharacterized protein n=1 Tax=Pyricularia grisea TaxID=148305 RepID=A0ABQ8N9P4_PYRGI|nr:hypothetical protein MCOR01_006812 [Pyricularia oryzae]KAI6293451.1 hypothetical protein MCOR33_009130 [Pyricularia grisea]KAI6253216.1 hypothetical protein MCOR19_010217 [Pyricularia oryzae]KAI6264500.1 hypothetical protein MCOR26_011316 [Pyricularia oryzae]KAI6307160.1 hypothetical protein MCOR29_009792 [Pyricularia oryzae]
MAPIDPRGLNYIAVDARVEEVLIRWLDKPTKSRAKNGSNLGLVERLKGHTILEEYTAISTGSKGKPVRSPHGTLDEDGGTGGHYVLV